MPYEDIEQSENESQQSYLYLIELPDRIYTWTNGPTTINATINGTAYSFTHPKGGIWHGSEGAGASDDDRKQDPGPTESPDAGRSGVDIQVSHQNPIVRAHRAFPPAGDSGVSIYRMNEIGGDPQPELIGYVITECPIEGAVGIIRCHHIAEIVSGSEGLSENHGFTCPYMTYHYPCPVPVAAFRQAVTVTDIDTENFTVEVSGSSQESTWFRSGVLEAPNGDKRLILEDEFDSESALRTLTILQNLPATTLKIGDAVTLLAGDDRLYSTCQFKFGAHTGNGAAFGGNHLQGNRNPHKVGRLQ